MKWQVQWWNVQRWQENGTGEKEKFKTIYNMFGFKVKVNPLVFIPKGKGRKRKWEEKGKRDKACRGEQRREKFI